MQGFNLRPQKKFGVSRWGKHGNSSGFGKRNKSSDYSKRFQTSDVIEYLCNIHYILSEKYEKYFAYELREEHIKKGNKVFNTLNLDFTYDLSDDICILLKIKEEIKRHERELVNERKCSRILEKLMYFCFFILKYNERNVHSVDITIQCVLIYNHFLKVIESNFVEFSKSMYASHFVQTTICVYPFFRKWEKNYLDEIKKKEESGYDSLQDCFTKISEAVITHLFELFFDKCATHVLRSFFYALAGVLHMNVSNISFRKSKMSKNRTSRVLTYKEEYYENEFFIKYATIIVDRLSQEINRPQQSLVYKDLSYQYIFYASDETENQYKEEEEKEELNEKTRALLMESRSQHFICPLLYNTFSVAALIILFDILTKKEVECNELIRSVFVLDRTKEYNKNSIKKNARIHDESPLTQVLNKLISLSGSSIMIEKLLQIKNQNSFDVFNLYILNNATGLICENEYSNLVMYNYLTVENITEPMFDLLMKNIDLDIIIQKKKFNVLRCLFNLSVFYKIHCKFLCTSLIKNLHLTDSTNSTNSQNYKFTWICICCMCDYFDLNPLVVSVLNEKEEDSEDDEKEEKEDSSKNKALKSRKENSLRLNNYNFYKYVKFTVDGCHILSSLLSFPKDAIVPLTNSFKYFCKFLKTVSENEPSMQDVESYNNFLEVFSTNAKKNNSIHHKSEENQAIEEEEAVEEEEEEHKTNEKEHEKEPEKESVFIEKSKKPFVRKDAILRGNILLYFSCDKNYSKVCEKITNTLYMINEKLSNRFISLFKKEYKNIAVHHIGCYVVVTFFKLGSFEIKKRILDHLMENEISVYNKYIIDFMKLKEYQKKKTVHSQNTKYLKTKKLFESILMPEEENLNKRDMEISTEKNDMDNRGNATNTEDNKIKDPAFENENGTIKEKKKKKHKNKSNVSEPKKIDETMENDKLTNIIGDIIKNTKHKSRKRKKEKEQMEKVLKKKINE